MIEADMPADVLAQLQAFESQGIKAGTKYLSLANNDIIVVL
jgi:hypothetical protein